MFHISGYHCPFLRLHVDLWILGTCFCVQASTLTELLGIQYSISVSFNLCWTHLLEKECSLYSEIKWALWSREEEILPNQSSSLELWKKKKKQCLIFFEGTQEFPSGFYLSQLPLLFCITVTFTAFPLAQTPLSLILPSWKQ